MKKYKKLLALLLVGAMLSGTMATTAFAGDEGETQEPSQETIGVDAYTLNCENTDETHEHTKSCYSKVEGGPFSYPQELLKEVRVLRGDCGCTAEPEVPVKPEKLFSIYSRANG